MAFCHLAVVTSYTMLLELARTSLLNIYFKSGHGARVKLRGKETRNISQKTNYL